MNPDFLIRIHSGENTTDPDGITKALKAIKKESEIYGNAYPRIRIGHAIHGVNEESINLMKEMNVEGIELNLSSNLALGNIEDANNSELQRTIELCKLYKIPIFIGTDGYGVYKSTPKKLFELAKNAGLNLEQIISDEWKYIEDRREDKRKIQKLSNDPNGLAKSRIREKLKSLKMGVLQSQDDKSLRGNESTKIPIIIAGGSFKTRGDGNFDEYREIALTMQVLADVIKPSACYFVTGGTNCGPERMLHNALQSRDKSSSKSNMKCIGLIPSYVGRFDDENAICDFDKIESNTITGGIICDSYSGWDDFAEELIKMANNNYNLNKNSIQGPKGMCIFIGGGETVKSEIRLASLGSKYTDVVKSFCYRGFGSQSASSQALKSDNENIVGFTDAESLIQQLYHFFGSEIFVNKFDIKKLPEYVEKSKKKVALDYQLFYETLIDEGKLSKDRLNMIKSLIESGKTQYIKTIVDDKDKLILKDLQLFIASYCTYLKERSADEMPEELVTYDGTRYGALGGIFGRIRNLIKKEDKNNGDR